MTEPTLLDGFEVPEGTPAPEPKTGGDLRAMCTVTLLLDARHGRLLVCHLRAHPGDRLHFDRSAIWPDPGGLWWATGPDPRTAGDGP